jgi:hypothetical protein
VSTLQILNKRIYQKSKKFNQRAGGAYLGVGVRLAESFCTEFLGHNHLLCQRSNCTHSIVDFGLLQLVGGEPGRVSTIGVLPHAVRLGSEWLNPALDEGADQLEARHFLFGCGS